MRAGFRDLFLGGALSASLAVADAAQAVPKPVRAAPTPARASPAPPSPVAPREQIPDALADSVEIPELPAAPRGLPASKGRCVLHPAAPRAKCGDRPAALAAL